MTGHYGSPLSRPWKLCHVCLLFKPMCPSVPFLRLLQLPQHLTHGWAMTSQTHTQGQGKGQGVHRLWGEGGNWGFQVL